MQGKHNWQGRPQHRPPPQTHTALPAAPSPCLAPARVESRNAKSPESGALNCSIAWWRAAAGVEPSSRWCLKPRSRK
eukprot:365860-Chlamydomonas_euryale.AAC.4